MALGQWAGWIRGDRVEDGQELGQCRVREKREDPPFLGSTHEFPLWTHSRGCREPCAQLMWSAGRPGHQGQGAALRTLLPGPGLLVSSSSGPCWKTHLGCGQPGQLRASEVIHTEGCRLLMPPTLRQDVGPQARHRVEAGQGRWHLQSQAQKGQPWSPPLLGDEGAD